MRMTRWMMTCLIVGWWPAIGGCDTSAQSLVGLGPASSDLPDGIDPSNPKIERTTLTVDFAGIRTVRIEIPRGRVFLAQTPGVTPSLRVAEIIIPDGRSREDLKRLLESSELRAKRSFVDATRLDLDAVIAPELTASDVSFDIRFIVPAGVNVEMFSDNAPVEVKDLTGNVEIETQDGEITLENINGSVVARTTNQAITAVNVSGNLQAETTSAAISLELTPSPGALISASTTDAAITLMLSRTTAAALDLTATNGVVSADLTGFAVSDVTFGAGFLKGVLNAGGGQVTAKTTNASIDFIGM